MSFGPQVLMVATIAILIAIVYRFGFWSPVPECKRIDLRKKAQKCAENLSPKRGENIAFKIGGDEDERKLFTGYLACQLRKAGWHVRYSNWNIWRSYLIASKEIRHFLPDPMYPDSSCPSTSGSTSEYDIWV
mgnify:CR=1 FL=1